MTSISAAIMWPNGRPYFFQGRRYVRYDVAADRADDGYPMMTRDHWNGLFNDDIDAAIMWPSGKAYFFSGDSYVRYDVAADRADPGYPAKIRDHWPGLFEDDIDAAIMWPNPKAYFFSGDSYTRYDVAADRADPGYPMEIRDHWPGLFEEDIDAAIMWPNGKAYFFSGDSYTRYDVAADRADTGYPQRIADHWPELIPFAVWANTTDVPTTVCFDARLEGQEEWLAYPHGRTNGQAGWDMGLMYGSLVDLASKLHGSSASATPSHVCGNTVRDCPPIRPGQITRLAINVHGGPGVLELDLPNGEDRLTVTSLGNAAVRKELDKIGRSLSRHATVLLTSCQAGQSDPGTKLLQGLSRVWPGRKVVGFATVGFAHGARMLRRGKQCAEPGMRDTANPWPAPTPELEEQRYKDLWDKLSDLPWASETSPHAKVAVDGRIVRGGTL
jgi:hypothetical protein